MTIPIRLACHGIEDWPSPSTVRELTNEGHHLILEIEPTDTEPRPDLRLVIDHFARELPDFTVFDGGGAVTIKRVIPAETVLTHADAIVAAATQFRLLAENLMLRLSSKLGLPLDVFFGLDYRPLLGRRWFRNQWSGKVDRAWRYSFHGYECWVQEPGHGTDPRRHLGLYQRVRHARSVLLSQFRRNNARPGNHWLTLPGSFPNPHRALMVLEQHERLQRITDPRTGRQGLAPSRP